LSDGAGEDRRPKRTGTPKVVFQTPWFEIATVNAQGEPGGTTGDYFCIVRDPGVICLVLDVEGNIVLVRQFRPPLGRTTIEVPAGSIDPGETPHQAAAREILEETGYVCRKLVRIASCRMALNREDVAESFFIGIGARPCDGRTGREDNVIEIVPRADFAKMIDRGEFEQTMALGGLYVAEKRFGFDLLRDDIVRIAGVLESVPE
jgi:ADP-ribose pyrophosphatase